MGLGFCHSPVVSLASAREGKREKQCCCGLDVDGGLAVDSGVPVCRLSITLRPRQPPLLDGSAGAGPQRGSITASSGSVPPLPAPPACVVSHAACLVPCVLCLAPHVSYLVSCVVPRVWRLISHTSCRVSRVLCLMPHGASHPTLEYEPGGSHMDVVEAPTSPSPAQAGGRAEEVHADPHHRPHDTHRPLPCSLFFCRGLCPSVRPRP